MKKGVLYADFETRSTVDLKKRGSDVYARHPSTNVMAFGYAFQDEPVAVSEIFTPPPTDVVSHVRSGGLLVAHNATFEWLIWNYVWKRQYPQLPALQIEQLRCTMVKCYAMGLPGSLEKAAPALGIDIQKDMKGQRTMLQLSQPRDILPNGDVVWWCPVEFEEKYQRMYNYCGVDIGVEREIDKRTLSLSKKEQELWFLDHKINQRGVGVDYSSALQAVHIVGLEQKRLNEEMRKVTGNAVASTNSHAQLTNWLRSRGVEVDSVAKSEINTLLEREGLPSDVHRALQIRQDAAKSSTAKFLSLIERTNMEDSKMRSTLQFIGAGTGRWTGRGFQVHNLPRPKLNDREIKSVFKILS